MKLDQYITWMNTTSVADRFKLLQAEQLPGRLGNSTTRPHDPGGYPVLLALMFEVDSSMPSDMKAAMSLIRVDNDWAPFIQVPPEGYNDKTFRHECKHITQFFENPIIRSYMIGALSHRLDDLLSIASFAAEQFAGRALAEVEVYRDVDGHPPEAAVLTALDAAISGLNKIVAYGISRDRKFLKTATPRIQKAAELVSASPNFTGYNVEKLVSRTLDRIQRRHSPTTQWADLDNSAVDDWVRRNHGKSLNESS